VIVVLAFYTDACFSVSEMTGHRPAVSTSGALCDGVSLIALTHHRFSVTPQWVEDG
jgi:hypothetical protein